MSKFVAIIGRCLVALLFIVAGANKLGDVAGTEAALTGAGLPGGLAVGIAIFEIVAGICLALGFLTRLFAVILAIYTFLVILFFYNRFNDPVLGRMALQNLAVIGGLALAFAHSHMWWHYDAMRRNRRSELAARDAEQRAHDAEIRAARAEATAEAATTAPAARPAMVEADGDGIADRRRRRFFDW